MSNKPLSREDARALSTALTDHFSGDRDRDLIKIVIVVFIVGTGIAWALGSWSAFARVGAAITIASIAHALRGAYFDAHVHDIQDVTVSSQTGILMLRNKSLTEEAAEAEARAQVALHLPRFFTAIQTRFVRAHLTAAAVGTLIWGFGDLPPYWWEMITRLYRFAAAAMG